MGIDDHIGIGGNGERVRSGRHLYPTPAPIYFDLDRHREGPISGNFPPQRQGVALSLCDETRQVGLSYIHLKEPA